MAANEEEGSPKGEQEGENVRGLVKPLVYTCLYQGLPDIYSQSAISETPSLTYYLQYTRIL